MRGGGRNEGKRGREGGGSEVSVFELIMKGNNGEESER